MKPAAIKLGQAAVAAGAFCFLLATSAIADEEQSGAYSLSAGNQLGNLAVWRLDSETGSVSLCMNAASGSPQCTEWSDPAPDEVKGPFAMNAEGSSPATRAWSWRISQVTGAVSFCTIDSSRNLPSQKPACSDWVK